jgi:hypothetical protein
MIILMVCEDTDHGWGAILRAFRVSVAKRIQSKNSTGVLVYTDASYFSMTAILL